MDYNTRGSYWRSNGNNIVLDNYIKKKTHFEVRYNTGYGFITPKGKVLSSITYQEKETTYFACVVKYNSVKNALWLYELTKHKSNKEQVAVLTKERPIYWFANGGLFWKVNDTIYNKELPISMLSCEKSNRFRMEQITQNGLTTMVALPNEEHNINYAITVCPGGPFSDIPDMNEPGSIYQLFLNAGFAVIIPLRRGLRGISPEWESALEENYGLYDVEDIIQGTKDAINCFPTISSCKIGLFGGSYGGYTALLVAADSRSKKLFNRTCVVCAMSDPLSYPMESQGDELSIKNTYQKSPSPLASSGNISTPMLLIHTLDDETVWFGQSVRLYNSLLKNHVNVELLLFNGAHSLEIPNKNALEVSIISFFNKMH